MSIETWPPPLCAVCNKPVALFERIRDNLGLRYEFRAHCHGAVQQQFVSDEVIEDGFEIAAGWAFAHEKLTEKKHD